MINENNKNIIILDEFLSIKVSHHNKKWYREHGFKKCNIGDVIEVKIDNLYPKTREKIRVQCPICKKIRMAEFTNVYYSKTNSTMCNSCATKSRKTFHKCEACEKEGTKRFENKYYCEKHYAQMITHGMTFEVSKSSPIIYEQQEDYDIMKVPYNHQYISCIIDKDVEFYINKYRWRYDKNNNTFTTKIKDKNIKLHIYIYEFYYGSQHGKYIRTKDGSLDYRKQNLYSSDNKETYIKEHDDVTEIKVVENIEIGKIDEDTYKILNFRKTTHNIGSEKDIIIKIDENGCWNCISHFLDRGGYAKVNVDGKKIRLHKKVLEIKIGRALNEDEVCRHMCDNPQCCNPKHLIEGSHQDNYDDMVSRGRAFWQKNIAKPVISKPTKKHKTKSILGEEEIKDIYVSVKTGKITQKEAIAKFNTTRGIVNNIMNKITHKDFTDELDKTIEYSKTDKIKDDIRLILNLSDSNLYTIRDIENLTGIGRETVRRIKNNTIYENEIKEVNLDRRTYKEGVLYVSGIIKNSDCNGEDFRNVLFLSKCTGMCGNSCQNKEYWDIRSGQPMSIEDAFDNIVDEHNEITFSGGECTLQSKQLIKLANMIKEKTNKTIWIYSGYTYEELQEDKDKFALIKKCDVLVDGRFNPIKAKENPNPLYRGSDNQRIIDIQKSLQQNKVVLYEN